MVVVAIEDHVDQPTVEIRHEKPKPFCWVDLRGALKPLSVQRGLIPKSVSNRQCKGNLVKKAEEHPEEVHPGQLANARVAFVEGQHEAVEDEAVQDV